jgi:N-formylglutamate amidohydrolase
MLESYFRIERPEELTLPVVVDVPHAGEWIPDGVRKEMVVGRRELKRDLDLYVDKLWADAPELGATLIASHVSRYVVDLNRADNDVSPKTVKGGKRIKKPGYYQDRGVVWRNTTSGVPVMASPMSKKTFKGRIDTFYRPYHDAIAEEIERVRKQFGYCILVDGHSMPSMGRSGHTDPGSRRADVVPGNANGTSCDVTVTWTVEEHFRDMSYSVKTNQPYKGGFITRNYGQPGQDVHAIQIEVNRDLYMNERTFVIDTEGLERLRRACKALLPKLADMDVK